ncbi:hypothetical protein E2C01_077276 [Portunus trituberculatus]|uniref:Uncharacterized protein n=1 Tax=Portunus trituberculatus TaxID=210409 RepID=A0A5B7IB08_PORTR|nr:hypothetical protein [Portunus trituberculatus]
MSRSGRRRRADTGTTSMPNPARPAIAGPRHLPRTARRSKNTTLQSFNPTGGSHGTYLTGVLAGPRLSNFTDSGTLFIALTLIPATSRAEQSSRAEQRRGEERRGEERKGEEEKEEGEEEDEERYMVL